MDGDRLCRKLSRLAENGVGFDELLEEAVRLVHGSSRKFHWTGIYEVASGDVLRLGPFLGAPTDHVLIPVGQGVCGSAVAENRNKVIPDVSREPNYLACSSSTRSELVVLVQKDGTIFAQIDIDSHDLAAFDEEEIASVQKVADWLAELYALHAKNQRA